MSLTDLFVYLSVIQLLTPPPFANFTIPPLLVLIQPRGVNFVNADVFQASGCGEMNLMSVHHLPLYHVMLSLQMIAQIIFCAESGLTVRDIT